MLAGASVWGADAVISRLWGMFAIALWDRQDRTLLLARDRLGKKPLYYAVSTTGILFGSELKSLRAHPAFSAEIDREALAAYSRYGYVPAPATIYTGASKLLPGHTLEFRRGEAPIIRSYWSARAVLEHGFSHRRQISDDQAIEELDTLLRDAVRRRMIADVPLGAFLSGGIDSSTVVALMQAQSARQVKTFSIGFHSKSFNEADSAKAVATHLGTDHTELYVKAADAIEVIPHLPDIYDEPFADSSQIPTMLVSQLSADPGHRRVVERMEETKCSAGTCRCSWATRIWGILVHLTPSARRAPGPIA